MTDQVYEVLKANADAVKRGQLSMWTIYDRPRDYPEGFIARRFEYDTPTSDTLKGDLDEIRKVLWQAGLLKLTRKDDDEPQIVETWV